MTTFSSMTYPTARAAHQCSTCSRRIDPSERYGRQAVFDDYVYTFRQCAHCLAVTDIYDPRDDENLISVDGFHWWVEADGANSVSELRAQAGWRMKWRTRSGRLLEVPVR